jgi:hypothetical protein
LLEIPQTVKIVKANAYSHKESINGTDAQIDEGPADAEQGIQCG